MPEIDNGPDYGVAGHIELPSSATAAERRGEVPQSGGRFRMATPFRAEQHSGGGAVADSSSQISAWLNAGAWSIHRFLLPNSNTNFPLQTSNAFLIVCLTPLARYL